jgi:hypothetical protein
MPSTRIARSLAAAALGSAALAPPAAAQAGAPMLSVDPINDSLIATGVPYGPATARVLRPDALTGAPVVIGHYSATSTGILPFSVNTTTPTPFNPGGDCWQKGALALPGGAGLTPDIRPGDTVTVTGGLSQTVPATPGSGPGGPGPGCGPLSLYGRSAVTAAGGGSGSDVTVSGVAQPLATGVAVSATDGAAATSPASATPAADGTWTATLPSAQLAALADGTLTLGAVFAVPDVATGAAAHIAGQPLAIQKKTVGGNVSVTPPAAPTAVPPVAPPAASPAAPAPAGSAPPAAVPPRLTGVRATAQLSLAAARRTGIRASFVVPAGARVVRVWLSRRGTTTFVKLLKAGSPGTRQTVRLAGADLGRRLRRGSYRISVAAGPSTSSLGHPVATTVRIR